MSLACQWCNGESCALRQLLLQVRSMKILVIAGTQSGVGKARHTAEGSLLASLTRCAPVVRGVRPHGSFQVQRRLSLSLLWPRLRLTPLGACARRARGLRVQAFKIGPGACGSALRMSLFENPGNSLALTPGVATRLPGPAGARGGDGALQLQPGRLAAGPVRGCAPAHPVRLLTPPCAGPPTWPAWRARRVTRTCA